MVRWIMIALLVAVNAVAGVPDFLTGGEDYLLRAGTYSFFHGSWWHVAVNCIAVWTVYGRKPLKAGRDFIVPYLIAAAVYPLSFRPVIGFSNVLYAALGLRTPPLGHPWWRRTEVLVFLAVTLLMAVTPRLSATTHIAAFALGTACGYVSRWWDKTTEDARRHY